MTPGGILCPPGGVSLPFLREPLVMGEEEEEAVVVVVLIPDV